MLAISKKADGVFRLDGKKLTLNGLPAAIFGDWPSVPEGFTEHGATARNGFLIKVRHNQTFTTNYDNYCKDRWRSL